MHSIGKGGMTSSFDEHWMRGSLAVATSRGRDPALSPTGCVIVRDSQIIGFAHNECQTLHDATAHAEMVAFRRAGAELADADNLGGELRDATLYSTLQPCGMCTMASIWAKVGRILGRDATTFIGCILKSGISTHSISLPTRIATT